MDVGTTTSVVPTPSTTIAPPFTYAEPQEVEPLDWGISITAVADLNADGIDDLVLALTTGLGGGEEVEPLFFVTTSEGELVNRTVEIIDGIVPEFFNVRDLLVADFNGDGRDDLFFSNHGKEEPAGDWMAWPCEQNRLLLSQPDGRLRDVTVTHLPELADFSHGSAAGDFDGDGDVDLFVNNLGCSTQTPSYVLVNDGTGLFTRSASAFDLWPGGRYEGGYSGPDWAVSLDANGDGFADLLTISFADTDILLGGPQGLGVPDGNTVPDTPIDRFTQGSTVADLDGDGLEDVVLLHTPDDFSLGHRLQILMNQGDGSFADETELRLREQTTDTAQGVLDVWAVDIEGDGDIDLLQLSWGPEWENGSNAFGFYINDGAGFFAPLDQSLLPPIDPRMTPIDLNSDRRLDYVFVLDGIAVILSR